MDGIEGLLITLKKRRLRVRDSGYGKESFLVWGYYDVLEMKNINSWNGFSPEIIDRDQEIDTFSNETQIKLIKPDNVDELIAHLKGSDSWISYMQGDIENHVFASKPLLPLVLLHFSKNATKTKGLRGVVSNLTELIHEYYYRRVEIEKTLRKSDVPIWAVYCSIGFMDAAIVCRSNNFAAVSDLVFWLRAKNELLESSYMLPCMLTKFGEPGSYDDKFKAWLECSYDNNTRVLLKTTFMPDISMDQFISAFNTELDSAEIPLCENYYEMFGSSDVLVLPDTSAANFARFYLKKEEKSLIAPPYRNMLTSTRSSICVDKNTGKPNIYVDPDDNDTREAEKRISEMLTEIIKDTECILRKRHKGALLNLASFYFDITVSAHTFDIHALMDPVLEELLKNIMRVKGRITLEGFTPDKFIESFTALRGTYTDLTNDYARADRHMFEGRWLKHPSVASAAKLAMAYHSFLVRVAEIFKHAGNSEDSTYTFLTASGGVDHVKCDRLFNFYFNNSDEEHLISIIRLPEADLFYISRTFFHIFHEMFHVIGDRHRPERNSGILRFLAHYAFWRLIYSSVSKDELKNEWKSSLYENAPSISARKERDIEFEKAFIDRITVCLEWFQDRCKDIWENGIKLRAPKSIHSKHWDLPALRAVEDDLMDSISNKNRQSGKAGKIYLLAEEILDEVLYFIPYACVKIGRGKSVDTHITAKTIKTQSTFENRKVEFSAPYKNVHETLKELLFEFFTENPSKGYVSAGHMLEDLADACREAFSDAAAITLLGVSKYQYLAMLYPKHNLTPFNDNFVDILRIESVIRACFPSDEPNEIYRVFISKYGNKHREEAINSFIETKHKFRFIFKSKMLTPIVEWLKLCSKSVDDKFKDHLSLLGRLRSIYQNALPPEEEIDSIPNISFEVLFDILREWEEMA